MKNIIAYTLCLFLTGCATVTGPGVSRQEVNEARKELKEKAIQYDLQQLHRLNDIADRLMEAVPAADWRERPAPFAGFTTRKIDKDLKEYFHLKQDEGVVIVDVRSNSPAEEAGLQVGDVVISVNGTQLKRNSKVSALLKNSKAGDIVNFKISRQGKILVVPVKLTQARPRFPVVLDKSPLINAATDGKSIYVMQGLLQFAKSDDVIAAVIAHELAHAVRGHVSKSRSAHILTSLLAVTVGIVAESSAPGSGSGVIRGVSGLGGIFNAKYSRDLEREADYYSVKYMYLAGYDVDVCATLQERFAIELSDSLVGDYLATHPSTPERVARMRKIVEEVKAGKMDVEDKTHDTRHTTQVLGD